MDFSYKDLQSVLKVITTGEYSDKIPDCVDSIIFKKLLPTLIDKEQTLNFLKEIINTQFTKFLYWINDREKELLGTLSKKIMKEPVTFLHDGRVYEKNVLVEYLENNNIGPMDEKEIKEEEKKFIEAKTTVNRTKDFYTKFFEDSIAYIETIFLFNDVTDELDETLNKSITELFQKIEEFQPNEEILMVQERYIQKYQNDPEKLFYYQKKRFMEMIKNKREVEKVLDFYKQIISQYEDNDEEKEQLIMLILEKYPEAVKVLIMIANMFIKKGKEEEAIKMVREGIKKGSLELINFYLDLMHNQGKDVVKVAKDEKLLEHCNTLEEKLSLLQKCLKYSPNDPNLLNNFIMLYGQSDNLERFVNSIEQIGLKVESLVFYLLKYFSQENSNKGGDEKETEQRLMNEIKKLENYVEEKDQKMFNLIKDRNESLEMRMVNMVEKSELEKLKKESDEKDLVIEKLNKKLEFIYQKLSEVERRVEFNKKDVEKRMEFNQKKLDLLQQNVKQHPDKFRQQYPERRTKPPFRRPVQPVVKKVDSSNYYDDNYYEDESSYSKQGYGNKPDKKHDDYYYEKRGGYENYNSYSQKERRPSDHNRKPVDQPRKNPPVQKRTKTDEGFLKRKKSPVRITEERFENTILVKNLDVDVSKQHVKDFVESHVGVNSVREIEMRDGYCFVKFPNFERVQKAVSEYDTGYSINNKEVDIYPVLKKGKDFKRCLVVFKGIPKDLKEKDLKHIFKKQGMVVDMYRKETGLVVEFASEYGVEECLKLNKKNLNGSEITVERYGFK